MAAARTQKAKQFSEAELQKMEEPLFVRIEREVAGRRTPMEVPPGEGEIIGGKGYTADMVRTIKHLTRQWGPGLYHIEITDKQGVSLVDTAFWNAESLAAQGYSTTVVQPSAAPATMPAIDPAMGLAGAPAAGGMPTNPYYLQSFFLNGGANGSAPAGARPIGWAPPGAAIPAYGGTPVTNPKDREEVLTLKAQMERERQEAQHRRDMESMAQEMRRMQEQISKRGPAEESESLKAAQREIEALKQQNSTQTIMGQMTAMQQQQSQQMAQMQANFERMMERQALETERRMAAMEASQNKADPMVQVMLSHTQAQAQQAQQTMQMFMTMMQQQQSQQMRPTEMLDMFRQANQGADQMAAAYGKAWELMANGVEQIIQAQGPGMHPAVAMIGQAAEGGLGMVQRYLEMKESEATANAQARQAAAHYEAQIQTEAIRAGAAKGIGVVPQQELSGNEEDDDETEETPEVPTEKEMRDAEKQILGAAWGPVQNLRRAVTSKQVNEEQCATAIFQAIEHFSAEGDLPPLFDLWKEERFAEFVDVLIPKAPYPFREKVTQLIYGAIAGMQKQAAVARAKATEAAK